MAMILKKNFSIKDYQDYVGWLYDKVDQMNFNDSEILVNANRFLMRGLKGIRKKDTWKTKHNLLISLSFYTQLASLLDIDMEKTVWERFPYLCSYCQQKPCNCKSRKTRRKQPVKINEALRPKTLSGFQKMFSEIYPPQSRTLENAGIHLAEEIGEIIEAHMIFRRNHKTKNFKNLELEMSDFFSCVVGVFNSLEIDLSREISKFYKNHCNGCRKGPCVCSFEKVMTYKS